MRLLHRACSENVAATIADTRLASRRRGIFLLVTAIVGLIPSAAVQIATAPRVAATNTYSQTVLGNSPVAYWRLGESSGNFADSTSNGNTATANGGVTYGASGAISGDANTGATLDGSTAYLEAPNSSTLNQPSSAITLESWVKPVSGAFASQKPIFVKGYTSHSNPYYQYALMMVDNSGDPAAVLMYLTIGGTLQSLTVDNAGWQYGQWNHIVGTYDGSRMRVYVNGQQVGSQSQTGSISNYSSTLDIGAYGNLSKTSSYLFGGGMDELAVYPTALTALQVQTDYVFHYAAQGGASTTSTPYTRAVLADSPAGYWRMDEASSGPYVRDRTSHGSDGTYSASGVSFAQAGALIDDSDSSVSFDGTVGYAGIPDSTWLDLPTTAISLEAWVKPTSGGFSSQKPILLKGYVGHSNPFYQYGLVMIDNASYPTGLTLYLSVGGSLVSLTVINSGWSYGQWNHIAGTYDGSQMQLYVNGQSVGTQVQSGVLDHYATALVMGAYANLGKTSNYLFSGDLDDTAVYASALSSNRILSHYLAGGNARKPASVPAQAELRAGGRNACVVCPVHANRGDPVDTSDGAYSESFSDMSIPGRGLALDFTRTYDTSTASASGPFGYGWTYGYNMSIGPATAGSDQTVTQENGSQVTFTYNATSGAYTAPSHAIATLVRNGDGTWTFQRQARSKYTFDTAGRLTAEKDLNGHTTTLAYTSGNLSSVADPAGRTVAVAWTGSHITSITDSNVTGNTRTATYQYNDGSGNLTDVIDVNGGHAQFTYDANHRVTVLKRPQCYATSGCPGIQTHYDSSGRVDWQKDPLNRQTTFSYSGDPASAIGSTTLTTDPAGHAVQDGYQWNIKTFETRAYATTAAATTSYGYDPTTLALTTILDPLGNLTTYSVDSNGNVTGTTDPLGRSTTKTYNAFNEVLTSQDGNGVTTTNSYDSNGNLATTSAPLMGTSPLQHQVTTYNHADSSHPADVTSVVDADSKTTSFEYDSYGNRVETKDPLGNVTGSVYNADGWLTASYSPKAGCTWGSAPPTGCSSTYETQYSYVIPGGSTIDEFGDVQTVTDPLSHVTTYGYDADRRKTSLKDGNGNTTTYTYDLAGQQTTTTRPDTTIAVTDYNSDGTVSDIKDGKSNAIQSYGYNALAQVTSVTDALSNVTTYTYDSNGNRLTNQDPGGSCTGTVSKCTTYTYDGGNQLKTITYSDGTTPNVTAITYDSDGQKTGMTDGTGSSTWSYDSLHRLTGYTNGNGDTVSYGYTYGSGPSYKLLNRPRTITYPNSVGSVTQAFDDAGRMTSVTDWNSKATSFAYDTNSNLITITDPSTTNVTDTYGFNAADQMTSVSSSNGSTLFSATYARDSNGQLASDSSQASNQSAYKYTTLNQLCYAGSSTSNVCSSPPSSAYPYSYDSADNLTANNGVTQQFNNADELCWSVSGTSSNACGSAPSGATAFSHDTRGNRTAAVPGSGSATCDSWDQENRLITVKTGTGSSCTSSATVGTYSYDGDGLRQGKIVGSTTTHFAWDEAGSLSLLLQEKAGSTVTSYVYGPGSTPVEQLTGSSTTWLHHDQLANIRLITDSIGSTATATSRAYDPEGNVVSNSGSLTSPFGFAGQYSDIESGLQYLRARYYDRINSQFLSHDPAVAKTRSPYGYAADNPLNMIDPGGASAGFGVPQSLSHLQPPCFRNPFGGNNDNGGCHTQLSTSEGGLALGAVGVIASGGALALPEAAAATAWGVTALGVTGVISGGLAAGADYGPCTQGNGEACFAFGLGVFATVGGGASLFLGGASSLGAFLGGFSFIVGGAGFAADLGYSLAGLGYCKP